MSAILVLLFAMPGAAQDRKEAAESNLKRLEAEISEKQEAKTALEKAAEEAAAQAAALSSELVAAARDIRIAEEAALHLEDRIDDLETEVAVKKNHLNARRGELLKLLSALERLSVRPAALTILQPSEALVTARSASLMGTLVPEINQQSKTLREELGILASLQDALSLERFDLKNTLAELTQHQHKLASLLDNRKREAKRASSDAAEVARQLADFAAKAADLKDLVDKLAQQAAKLQASKPEAGRRVPGRPARIAIGNGRPMSQMKGLLTVPAIGSVVTRFGEQDGAGHARGMRFKTRERAQVVAPYDGQIVYAGPFRNYGQLLIIAHGDGYHSLLAGFEELQGVVGQWVLTGEPVGSMSDNAAVAELYLELRHKGESVDPAPWLGRMTAAR